MNCQQCGNNTATHPSLARPGQHVCPPCYVGQATQRIEDLEYEISHLRQDIKVAEGGVTPIRQRKRKR